MRIQLLLIPFPWFTAFLPVNAQKISFNITTFEKLPDLQLKLIDTIRLNDG